MVIALIVLVIMSLGGLALIRSMDTSNLIAGNMAFQQAATHSADAGVEAAVAWLETNNTVAGALNTSNANMGYSASTPNITATQTGEAFWNSLSPSGICWIPLVGGACSTAPGVPDASGNTMAFMIQRLCSGTGAPASSGCAIVPNSGVAAGANLGNNEGSNEEIIVPTNTGTAVYYRITVRVNGPRNTASFVQATVSM